MKITCECGHPVHRHRISGCFGEDIAVLGATCECNLSCEAVEARYWARKMKCLWQDAEKRVGVLVALIDRMEKQIGAQGDEINRETNELYRLHSVLMQIATKSSDSEIRVLAVDAVNRR